MSKLLAFKPPPELNASQSEASVAIVGGGPVGLALALELARFGVRSAVIEARDRVDPGSRAICISGRSMDILDGVGVGEAFRTKGLGWVRGRSFYRRRVVFELEMPFPPLQKHFPMTNLQQSHMEEFLVERAERRPEIDLRWQSTVSNVSPEATRVRCLVETPAGDYELSTPYLVACDGARSVVRESLGLRMEGYASPGRYLIADIRLKSTHPTERRAWFDPPCNPGSTALMHKQPDDIWRVDFQILGSGSDEEELVEGRVRDRIRSLLEMIGETAPWELVWKSLYKAYGLALGSYRHGRVLFAGDAAHLVPIFGVRGLNSGFADANNLGWKLAVHSRGLASDALLDSYDFERRAATHDILRQAEKSTIFMTPPTEGYRIMRDAALSLAIRHEFARGLIDPRQSVPYDYLESPLNSFDDAEPASVAVPRTGAPLPNLRLGATFPGDWQPQHLLDAMGPYFTALLFVDDPDEISPIERFEKALVEAEVPCQLVTISSREPILQDRRMLLDVEHKLATNLGAAAGSVILVRPDAHLCARLRAPTVERLRAALRRAVAIEIDGPPAAIVTGGGEPS